MRTHVTYQSVKRLQNDVFLLKVQQVGGVNHAVSVKGGPWLVLKTVNTSKFPKEIDIMKFLAEDPRGSDPENRAVLPIEVLVHPTERDLSILVLPLLRAFDDPGFETMGEALDFILQFFKASRYVRALYTLLMIKYRPLLFYTNIGYLMG